MRLLGKLVELSKFCGSLCLTARASRGELLRSGNLGSCPAGRFCSDTRYRSCVGESGFGFGSSRLLCSDALLFGTTSPFSGNALSFNSACPLSGKPFPLGTSCPLGGDAFFFSTTSPLGGDALFFNSASFFGGDACSLGTTRPLGGELRLLSGNPLLLGTSLLLAKFAAGERALSAGVFRHSHLLKESNKIECNEEITN